jgi:hypothetical protein
VTTDRLLGRACLGWCPVAGSERDGVPTRGGLPAVRITVWAPVYPEMVGMLIGIGVWGLGKPEAQGLSAGSLLRDHQAIVAAFPTPCVSRQ